MFKILAIFTACFLVIPPTQVYGESEADSAIGAEEPVEGDHKFGRYRLRLSVGSVAFSDELKSYKSFYGEPGAIFLLAGEMLAFKGAIDVGFGFQGGYYRDSGYALRPVEGSTDGSLESNKNAPISLTLVPFQAYVKGQLGWPGVKYLVIEGWAGFEWLRYTERRESAIEGEEAAEEQDADVFVNSSVKTGLVTGLGLSILISGLDQQSTNSMRYSMGLGDIYLTPYVQLVKQLSDEGGDFSRSEIGVGFTFESFD